MSDKSSPEHKNFKVALVGGGICGLTCAIALIRAGVPVQIFEAAAKLGEIGAGVGLGPNAVRILRTLGVLDDVLEKCNESELSTRMFRFVSGMEGHEVLYDLILVKYPESEENGGLGAHRAALLDALQKFIDPSIIHFKKRCVSVAPIENDPTRVVITFDDNTVYEADLVIGADGVHSAVRTAVTGGGENKAAFSNAICYRGLFPADMLKKASVKTDVTARSVCFVGKDKHLIVFPIKHAELINVVAFAADHKAPIGSKELEYPSVKDVSQKELLNEYEAWGSDVIDILKCIKTPSKWSIPVVYPPLETYVKGRIIVAGDSAHGMLPHLGAGAGQCIEDAYVIAQLLGHPGTTGSNIEAVLEAYDRVRRPRAQMVWEGSVKAGEIYDGYGEHGLSPQGIQEDLGGMWDRVWHHDVEDDVKSAVSWLRATTFGA
ncbi:predicted protein [Postia placenta Mad-698-R]|nr:predicted protein [Postia placenta Mad-698-R]